MQTPDLGDVEGLKEMLWKRDISLVLVSSDLDRQRVLSVTWDQQVMCRGCSKDKVFLPNVSLWLCVCVCVLSLIHISEPTRRS